MPAPPPGTSPPQANQGLNVGDFQADFVDASLFTSLNDSEQDYKRPQPKRTKPARPTRATKSSSSGPKPWMRLPWHKRFFMVPYLFSLVWIDYARRFFMGLQWFTRKWMQAHPGAATRAGETVFWPMAFIALSQWSNLENPLYINEGFPWPWIGVWLVALRYGALSGLVGTMLLLASWYVLPGDQSASEFPRMYFLGGAITALIAGEFGSLWGSRTQRQHEAMRYLDAKIDRLTRRLYLLKLSHDELEFEMVERPATLRDALAELQGKLNVLRDSRNLMSGASLMLDFWTAHGQIEIGALYQYLDGPRPRVARAASVGDCPDLAADDPMLMRAVEAGQAVHLLDRLSDASTGEQALAVFPMRDTQERVFGVLVVYRMPFMAFNADNLRNIGVLVDAYAAWLEVREKAIPLLDAWPDAPQGLVQEFAWLQHLHRAHGIDSGCVIWRARGNQAPFALQSVAKLHDNAAMAWTLRAGAIVTLSPFIGRKRLTYQESQVLEKVGTQLSSLESTELHPQSLVLADAHTWAVLRDCAAAAGREERRK